MLRIALPLFLLLSATSLPAETVYKYVDENGNLVFTDEPRKGAEALDIKPVATMPALPTTPPQREKTVAGPFQYNKVLIVSPANQQHFINENEPIVVQVAVSPNLRTEDRVQLLLNGAARGAPISSTSFSLDNLDRGEYQAQVKILDKNGKEMGTSDSVTFQVKRHSKLMPNAGGQSGTKPVNTPVKKNP